MGQAPGMPPVMINPQVGSGSFDLNGTSGMIEQPQFGQIPQIQSAPQEPKKSFGKKALDFIGQATGISGLYGASKKAGEISQASDQLGLGIHEEVSRLIAEAKKFKTGDPKRKALLKKAQEVAQAGGQGADALLGAVPKDRQVIGSAGKLALTVGSLGMGAPATVGGRLAAGTLTGGAFGGLDAAERGGDLGDIAKGAGIGAATGLAVGGLFEGVRWAAQHLPKRLLTGVSGLTNTDANTAKGQKAIEYLAKKHRIGTSASLTKQAQDSLDDLIAQADDMVERAMKGNATYADRIDDIYAKIANAYPDSGYDAAGIRELISKANPRVRVLIDSVDVLPVDKMNVLRKTVGKQLGDRGFKNQADSFVKDVVADYYFALSDKLNAILPDSATGAKFQQLLSDQSSEITLLKGLKRLAANTSNNKNLTLGDMIAASGGFAGASVPGAVGAVILNKALHSTLVNSVAANMVGPISNVLIKLAPAEQQLIIQAIANSNGKE